MKTRSLVVILLVAALGACGNVGSGSNGITSIADAAVSTACTDDFDPSCWTYPWGEFEPPFVYVPDAGVDATADEPHPDAGCTAQAEPACPQPPGGYRAQNPGIPGGGQCRGACGPACPATCRAGTPTTRCLEWQTADCQWHAKVCTYPVLDCGSAQGCRDHDSCYDGCALLPFGLRTACRRECDVTCIWRHGIKTCNSWRKGNGPYDSWLSYTGAPTSTTSNTTCF